MPYTLPPPTTPAPPMGKGPKRLIGCGAILTVGFVAIFTALILLVSGMLSGPRLDEELAAIAAKGEPTTPEDLRALYVEGARSPNVAPELEALFSPILIASGEWEGARVVDRHFEWPDPWAPLPGADTPPRPEHLALLDKAAAVLDRGDARFDIDFGAGFNAEFFHQKPLEALARMHLAVALRAAHTGDADGALQGLERALRVADQFRTEPTLMAQLVRQAVVGLAMKTATRFLHAGLFNADQLAALQEVFEAVRHRDALRIALYGERLAPLFTDVEKAVDGATAKPSPNSAGAHYFARLFESRLVTNYLVYSTKVVDATDESFADRKNLADELDAELDLESSGLYLNLHKVIAIIALPAVINGQFDFDREEAKVSATVAAIAVMRYRAQRGGLPDSLDALVPAYLEQVPLDPFDGRPLRYLPSEYGFRVYSIGPDEHDDGGQRPEGHREQPGDLVVEVRLTASADDDD